jgi:hypothetical protein
MSESQPRYDQSSQHPQKDPCGSKPDPDPKPDPKPDPCDPKPEDCRPPCPADEDCPPKKRPCPCPPDFEPPDWCEELPPVPEDCPEPTPEPTPTPTDDDPCGPSRKPTEQLADLRARLVASRKTLQSLAPAQLEADDLKTRIEELEARVANQPTKDSEYKAFYRATEVLKSEIECFIPTVRCQLELKDYQKKCVCAAIERVDKRIARNRREAWAAEIKARHADRAFKEADAKLKWAKENFEFLETGLKARVEAVRDELVDLKGKVNPNDDQCIAYFYLYELDRLIQVCKDDGPCWKADIGVGTFIECWDPECFAKAHNRMLAAFNDAEADQKIKESALTNATQLAKDLKEAADASVKSRRADILAEIAAHDCCGKCPPPTKEDGGREAR